MTTPAYSVVLKGLPSDITVQEIREFCEQFGQVYKAQDPKPNIFKNTFDESGVVLIRDEGKFISLCYDMLEKMDMARSIDPADTKGKQKCDDDFMALRKRSQTYSI